MEDNKVSKAAIRASIKDLNSAAIELMKSERVDIKNAGWLLWMLIGICDRLVTNSMLLEDGNIEDDRGWTIQSTIKDIIWLIEHTK